MIKARSWFCITDGRPWYKQAVTGAFVAVFFALFTFFAGLALAIIWGIIDAFGVLELIKWVGILVAGVVLILVFVGLLGALLEWAISG